MNNALRIGAVVAVTCLTVPAFAHIQLDEPTQREGAQKAGPCGAANSTRGSDITALTGGSSFTVKWRETINHPSHYRISIDLDGQDGFEDPASQDDFFTNDLVLADNIADGGTPYETTITIPNMDCDNCTLQLIQVMYDKPPYGDGNDMYYQCADITITADPNAPDMGGTDMGVDMAMPACVENTDCEMGEVCTDGVCEMGSNTCGLDSHCQAGEICENGACEIGSRNNLNNANNNTGNNNSGPDMGDDAGDNGGGSDDGGDDDGCTAVAGSSAHTPFALLLLALGLVGFRRRRT